MQHMPDKEFDQLFRDKFEDAEIEPSANLWANIEQQLAPKRKRVFPIYWMAAASITIAITAMLVLQKSEKIQLRADNVTAAVVEPSTENVVVSANDNNEVSRTVIADASTLAPVRTLSVKVSKVAPENKLQNFQLALQPNTNDDRLPIKQQDVKPLDVLPVKELITENPTVIAYQPQQITTDNMISETDPINERKGIRNVGDIVNYVVDKVDKRDKKLVRFNTDDDDNSSIVGINIGFLKLNKKNR